MTTLRVYKSISVSFNYFIQYFLISICLKLRKYEIPKYVFFLLILYLMSLDVPLFFLHFMEKWTINI